MSIRRTTTRAAAATALAFTVALGVPAAGVHPDPGDQR